MDNRRYRFLAPVLCALLLTVLEGCAARRDSLRDLPSHAVARSQIMLSGSSPFHLHAKVFEATNPDNDNYNAEIDEIWAAPNKWRRTVKSAKFSEILIANGDNVIDQIT